MAGEVFIRQFVSRERILFISVTGDFNSVSTEYISIATEFKYVAIESIFAKTNIMSD